MVEFQLAKLEIRVRFPVSAQNTTFHALAALGVFIFHSSDFAKSKQILEIFIPSEQSDLCSEQDRTSRGLTSLLSLYREGETF